MSEPANQRDGAIAQLRRQLAKLQASQARLEQAEERLRFMRFSIEHAPEGAFWVGPDARFLYVNDTACRTLGYSREEAIYVLGRLRPIIDREFAEHGFRNMGEASLGSDMLFSRARVASLAEPRSIALLLAVAAVVGLLAGPVQNLVSRRIEARADAHALALTYDPTAFGQMQGRLALVNLGDVDPNPVEYALFASHPSTVERMAAARAWARARP